MATPFDGIYAAAPATVRGQPSVLSVDAKGEKLLYGCGRAVILRSIKDPLMAELYTEHQKDVTVAKFSPSGNYIASADVSGVVKIWAADNMEHPLKFEGQCLSGAVTDLQWSPDSQRVVAVGDGRDSFGRVFMWDTGSSVGEISGHGKKILSCDFKQTRPFQIVTASEDMQVNTFDGPPFKFKQAFKEHTKFANCARYSPDGTKIATVGSDMLCYILDSASGNKLGQLKGHKGSVYSCSWSSDSTRLATASADKTVIVWDTTSFAQIGAFAFADKPTPEDMQVACVWVPNSDTIISLSLRGDLFYCNAAAPGKPSLEIKGHNKSINAMAVERSTGTIVSGSYDGVVNRFTIGQSAAAALTGKGHTNAIVDLILTQGKLLSCGMDDTLRVSALSDMQYSPESVPLGAQPSGMVLSRDGSTLIVSTNKSLLVFRGQGGAGWKLASTTSIVFQALGVALSPDGSEVAVGGDDNGIHIYSLAGDKLTAGAVLNQHPSGVTKVAYSPCGKMLASGDATKNVVVWDAGSKQTMQTENVHHQAKVTSLDWSPDSKRLVSGSLDTKVIVWDIAGGPSKRIMLDRAHPGGVSSVRFVADNRVASTGADCNIKMWTV